jgi:D-tyrosyl-tRNA(Tyr) deacylase
VRVVLQRVKSASVTVEGEVISEIGAGLLLLVGIEDPDEKDQAGWLAEKIAGLRVFNDADGRMNRSVRDVESEVLAVSQFTLLADTRKGKRPSFVRAARPERAGPLFDYFCEKLRDTGVRCVRTGRFGAMMDVALVNNGPVTIVLDR